MENISVFEVQKRIMEIGLKSGCGHVASAMSVSELLCKLYKDFPKGIVILSKGHAVLAQYVILNMLGKITDKELETYYKDGGLSGHATLNNKHGIYASTGSLGHGLAIGIGYAIANPKKKVLVVLGDGECDEGSTLEAFKIIQRLKVKNIVPVIDVNGFKGFGRVVEQQLPLNAMRWYSVKGEGFGKYSNKLESHYKKIDDKIFNTWLRYAKRKYNK